jgi:hypothetical protein
MDGVGVSQISSGTGLPIITVLETSVVIRKELTLYVYLLDDDPDATLKAMKDNSVRSYSMNMATTFPVHEIRMELEELSPSDVGQRTRM